MAEGRGWKLVSPAGALTSQPSYYAVVDSTSERKTRRSSRSSTAQRDPGLKTAITKGKQSCWQCQGLTNSNWPTTKIVTEIAELLLGVTRAVGPRRAWIRLDESHSRTLKRDTGLSLMWGSNKNYRIEIGSPTLRNLNESLRNQRIPVNSPRTVDPGHLHIILGDSTTITPKPAPKLDDPTR
jgi:hypothetical protein